MQTLQRLAGVQETSDSSTQPPAPVSQTTNIPPPPPIPRDSIDDTDAHSQRRASLPLNRRPSHRSFPSHRSKRSVSRSASHDADSGALPADYPPTPKRAQIDTNNDNAHSVLPRTSGESDRTDDEEEDFTWGPSHPCFPHPNPHCSPTSQQYASTRAIRVKRDFLAAGDLCPQYANLYPEILDPLVSDSEFRQLISSLNALLVKSFSPHTTRAYVDSILGAFTGYIWEDLGLTGAKKGEKEVERFIERWNQEKEREGVEVRIMQLRQTGFMSLDFVVPDPGIDMPRDEESDDEPRDGQGLQEVLQADGGATNSAE